MTLDTHLVAPWTAEEVRTVVEAFGLGTSLVGHRPLPIVGWDSQRARCRVRTVSGGYFLKKHHPEAVRRGIHNLVRRFIDAGGRAPEVIALPDGGTWFEGNGWVAEAQRLVPGAPLDEPTAETARDAAELLARWHSVPTWTAPAGWSDWFEPADAGRLLPFIVARIARRGLPVGPLTRLADAVINDATHPGRPSLVHGDLWRGNWVLDGGRLAALTDFDWCHRGARVSDLADLVLAMASDRDAPAENARADGVDVNRAADIIGRYETAAGPLDARERAAFGAEIRSQWLRHLVWRLRDLDDPVLLNVLLDRTARFERSVESIVST